MTMNICTKRGERASGCAPASSLSCSCPPCLSPRLAASAWSRGYAAVPRWTGRGSVRSLGGRVQRDDASKRSSTSARAHASLFAKLSAGRGSVDAPWRRALKPRQRHTCMCAVAGTLDAAQRLGCVGVAGERMRGLMGRGVTSEGSVREVRASERDILSAGRENNKIQWFQRQGFGGPASGSVEKNSNTCSKNRNLKWSVASGGRDERS